MLLDSHWRVSPATISALRHAQAIAFLRVAARVSTHAQEGDPRGGVAAQPPARGSKTSPYKKKKGLEGQHVDNKGIVAGTLPPNSEPVVSLIPLGNQGDAR